MIKLHIIPEKSLTLSYQGYFIKVAKDAESINKATQLLNHVYDKKGYGKEHTIVSSPQHITLVVYSEEDMIGTLTLNVDDKHKMDTGLFAEQLFKEEIQSYREANKKICEIIKFAFTHKIDSKSIIALLFHIMFVYGAYVHNCTDIFIEVNPRHKRFYETMLGFKSIGTVKHNLRVNAPAHLLHLSLCYVEKQKYQFNKNILPPLYNYFFSLKDEIYLYHEIIKNINN